MEKCRGRNAQGCSDEVWTQSMGPNLLSISQKINEASPGLMERVPGSQNKEDPMDSGGEQETHLAIWNVSQSMEDNCHSAGEKSSYVPGAV